MKRIISTVFLSLLLTAIPVGAAELFPDEGVVEPIGHGEINWTLKQIRARGSGAPNLDAQNVAVVRLGAERAAKMDALCKCAPTQHRRTACPALRAATSTAKPIS